MGTPLAGAVLVILAVLTLLDVGPLGPGEELRRDELLAHGNAICRQAGEQYAELQREPPRAAAEAADLTANLLSISEQELEAMRELDPPADLEAPLERYLTAREKGIALLRGGLEAAEGSDASAYADAQQAVAASQQERSGLAAEVGLSECSRVLSEAAGRK